MKKRKKQETVNAECREPSANQLYENTYRQQQILVQELRTEIQELKWELEQKNRVLATICMQLTPYFKSQEYITHDMDKLPSHL